MKRRDFIAALGGAAVVGPRGAWGQTPSTPTIGFLNPTAPQTNVERLRAFHRGLKDTGYTDNQNVAIEYRWAEGNFDRLPEMAIDLVRRQVSVIATTGGPLPALAAKGATTTIPIVFAVALDPVSIGLVQSLARPEANLTGVSIFNTELTAKRLELLHQFLPSAVRVAVLVNPTSTINTKNTLKEAEQAARSIGFQIEMVKANNADEIEAAFEVFRRARPHALLVGNDGLFVTHRVRLSTLAVRYGLPAIYASREIVDVGGLMSYGTNIVQAFYESGMYTGRVLSGTKPGDLPVLQSSKFELVINLPTAKALGLTVSPTLLARANEVIE